MDYKKKVHGLKGDGPAVMPRDRVAHANLLAHEWMNSSHLPKANAPVTTADGYSIKTHVHERIIEASKGGKVIWNFVAGGRISRQPLIYKGMFTSVGMTAMLTHSNYQMVH